MKYSILINTCDKFEDCWNPFFKLWSIYWKDCNAKVYLNTEYKDYSYPGLNIYPIKGCLNNNVPKTKRATWSQCLKWALECIDSDVILYMQEDYFLKDKVKNNIVEQYVRLMLDNPQIDCIQLTDQAVYPQNKSNFPHLNTVKMNDWSVVSCQASLWQKNSLKELIRDYESAWNFEWFGSKRAKILKHNYFVVDKELAQLNEHEIIPYIFTGVIGGKWYKPVEYLFKKHNIEIDFSKRGFYEKSRNKTLPSKIKRIPIKIRAQIDLFILRWKQMY